MTRNYYGAMIRNLTLGPRRELTLEIETWPENSVFFEKGQGRMVKVRFGAIANYEEVEQQFATLPQNGLHYMRERKESNPARRVTEIQFDGCDRSIRIVSGNITEVVED